MSNVGHLKHFIDPLRKKNFFSREEFSLFSLSQIKEKIKKKTRKSWLVLNLTCTLLNYKSLNFSLVFLFVTVCNFVVHDRCLKAVVSPCSSIAASLIKVRIPSVSVLPLFRVTRDQVNSSLRDLYLHAAENTHGCTISWLRPNFSRSRRRMNFVNITVSALATRLWYFRRTLFLMRPQLPLLFFREKNSSSNKNSRGRSSFTTICVLKSLGYFLLIFFFPR